MIRATTAKQSEHMRFHDSSAAKHRAALSISLMEPAPSSRRRRVLVAELEIPDHRAMFSLHLCQTQLHASSAISWLTCPTPGHALEDRHCKNIVNDCVKTSIPL